MGFAIFDIETRIDKSLLNRVLFAGQSLEDEEAYRRYLAARRERGGSDFMPVTMHVPISIAVGDVADNHVLRSVESLALADYSEEKLVRAFWERSERFAGCLVSFNGRGFDLPVLELQALRYGIAAPGHFAQSGAARSRYLDTRHLDLCDFIANHGAIRLTGGMNLLLKMIGMPGKGATDGSRVQELYEADRMDEIHRYCRDDVIQTYFLFIRVELMRGRISAAAYRAAHDASAPFLAQLNG